MITFSAVWFQNFMSFGNQVTTIDLATPGSTFINGVNIDKGGSSGAGKSTIINAILVALFDKPLNNISKDRLINKTNAAKTTLMTVGVKFNVDDNVYTIERNRGAHVGVVLTCNGVDITPASLASINTDIEAIIGMSYNLFARTVVFNGNSIKFLELPVGDQRELIEELFKITELSTKADILKKQTDTSVGELNIATALYNERVATNTRNEAAFNARQEKGMADVERRNRIAVEQATSRFNAAKQAAVRRAEANAALVKRHADEYETRKHDAAKALETATNNLLDWERRKDASIEQLEAQLALCGSFSIKEIKKAQEFHETALQARTAEQQLMSQAKTELSNVERLLKSAEDSIKKNNGEITHLLDAKCPYCTQTMDAANVAIKIADLEKENKIKTEVVAVNLLVRDGLLEAISQHQEKIDVYQSRLSTRKFADELEFANSAESLTQEIKAKKEAENPFENTYFLLESTAMPEFQPLVIEELVEDEPVMETVVLETFELTENFVPDVVSTEEIDSLTQLIEHQKMLRTLLTNKNSFIRKAILNTTIPFLNERINQYTDHMLLPHTISFNTDMTCTISEHGRELDHGNLSNGEAKRLNLALCWAFRDVQIRLHQKINLLFCDEIDGGSLCIPTTMALLSLLRYKVTHEQCNVWVISHNPEFDGRLDNVVTVTKELGFSFIND